MGKALEWLGVAGCRSVALDIFESAHDRGEFVEANCPLSVHATPDPCFRYYPGDDHGHCHACKQTSDLLGCYNVLHGRDPQDADGFREFRDRYAHGASTSPRRDAAPKARRPAGFVPAPSVAPEEAWQTRAYDLAREAHQAILGNPAGRFTVEISGEKQEVEMGALDYLREHRGLTLDTVRRFGLGWIGERVYRSRESWGLPPLEWENGKPRSLCIKRGLLIPTFGRAVAEGRREVLRLRVRLAADEKGPKYQLVEGSRNRPVVINPGALAHVVEETELDGMLVAQEAGDVVGVVMVGAAKLQPQAEEHAIIAASRCLLVAMDAGETPNDWSAWLSRLLLRPKKGLRAALVGEHWAVRPFIRPRFRGAGAEAGDWWLANYPQARRWPVPEGKDIGEYWCLGNDLRLWIMAGLPAGVRFMIERRATAAPSPAPRPVPAPKPAPVPAAADPKKMVARERPAPRPAQERTAPAAGRPSDGLFLPRDGRQAVESLRACGLEPEPDGQGDYEVRGHERWPVEDVARLFAWLRRHGELVREAVCDHAPEEER